MKHTKDTTKTPFHLIPLDFVAAMARRMQKGTIGNRKPFDWQMLTWRLDIEGGRNYQQYFSAIMRHLQKADDLDRPKDERCEHWIAIACNAMIAWFNERKGVP